MKFKKLTPFFRNVIILIIVSIILNLGNLSHSFCDWYALHIYPIFVSTYGRIMSIFPFSVGEYLIMLGIAVVIAAIIISILLIFLKKKPKYKKFAIIYLKIFTYILFGVFIVMTLNCTLVYNCSPLVINEQARKEYTDKELENLRNYIVIKCNEYASKMERDENGDIIYDKDIVLESRKAMHALSKDYPRMKGYYPKAKPINNSAFMSQSYTSGVFFPFSMEANYNNIMYLPNYPAVICHEYAHLKGYMLEDECNFFGYLACINTDDNFFKYSGYLSVLYYVDISYYDSVGADRYFSQVEIDSQVYEDNVFLKQEVWEEVEEDAVISTETVDKISDDFTDSSIKFFGDMDGMASYDRVTELLLQFYDGKLY